MYLFTVALHVVLCVLLVLIIILQPGKGGDVGSAFGGGGGGGGSQMFGPRGPTNILQQATTVVAVMFMATSMTLALYSSKSVLAGSTVEDELLRMEAEQQEQNAPPADVAPEAPVEAPVVPVEPSADDAEEVPEEGE
jgi:preprotein translocase subunit SecG